jgi:glucosamine 6-phosphate synthetase-like amidotransferase/phosphosugar isomerase protein
LVDNRLHAILKTAGIAPLSNLLVIEYEKKKKKITDFEYYLGHTQAPTSAQRAYSKSTTHPFQCKDWIIAHNGVLTNEKELKKILDKKKYNIVDSSIIAPLIEKYYKEYDDEVAAISKALSQLKGTFGLWIFHQQSNNIYLARSGSTLYADFLNNSFSSLKEDGYVELEEGLLYLLTQEGITCVGRFKKNSPFFT